MLLEAIPQNISASKFSRYTVIILSTRCTSYTINAMCLIVQSCIYIQVMLDYYCYLYSELQAVLNGAVIEGDISPKPSHKQDSQE